MTCINPWDHIAPQTLNPTSNSYILPCDLPYVDVFNKSATSNHFIHGELLPDPFCGRFDAPVVVLLLNPGYDSHDFHCHCQPKFQSGLRQSFLGNSPHFYLSGTNGCLAGGGACSAGSVCPGRNWWQKTAKEIIKSFGQQCVAENLLSVEYFPYHSKNFGHARLRLPSQDFTFCLVRDAIARDAVIVCVRGEKEWLGAIPALNKYRNFYTKGRSTMKAALSRKNLGDPAFDAMCNELKAHCRLGSPQSAGLSNKASGGALGRPKSPST